MNNRNVQGLESKLQAVLDNQDGKAAPSPVAIGAIGGKLSDGDANQAAQGFNAQDSNGASNNPTLSATSEFANSMDVNIRTQIADSAAVVKAAGLAAVTADQSLHTPADAPGQSVWVDAGAATVQAGKENNPVSTPELSNPAPHGAPLPQSLADVAQASQLYQRASEAEMHLAMQTDTLGSVELHAVVHQSTLSATIGVQRADVQSLLASDLPALQRALAEQRLHVEQISVLDTSVGGNLSQSGHHQKQNSSEASPFFGVAGDEAGHGREDGVGTAWSEAIVLGEDGSTLSIRA